MNWIYINSQCASQLPQNLPNLAAMYGLCCQNTPKRTNTQPQLDPKCLAAFFLRTDVELAESARLLSVDQTTRQPSTRTGTELCATVTHGGAQRRKKRAFDEEVKQLPASTDGAREECELEAGSWKLDVFHIYGGDGSDKRRRTKTESVDDDDDGGGIQTVENPPDDGLLSDHVLAHRADRCMTAHVLVRWLRT
ncbi:hypothetical protein D9C73_014449 [Collichthys lucidus]|uniref:Uncharacterized protein n=1 Tax=Collichthys lucidus TaxID=240159 RepID=A0A4U5UX61_COLLU|nr:hypothetical protein D9C73_014449 [Collichthys lucidus]